MEKLIDEIQCEIRKNCSINNLSVKMDNKMIKLEGLTSSFYNKQKAQVVAMLRLPKEFSLENEIFVKYGSQVRKNVVE